MPLTDQEKTELAGQVKLLEEMGEPEALVAALRRACLRKASDALTPKAEAMRWQAAADELFVAETSINARQTPEAKKLEQHIAEWSAAARPADAPEPPAA
jgi:hypothetical protein